MKTDYKNLNVVDVLAVVFASAGLLLFGAISFSALPSHNQVRVAKAIQIFDMHEQLSAQAEGFKLLAYDLPQDFLGEFYQAFTEVAVIPYETIQSWQVLGNDTKIVYTQLMVFSETLAAEYDKNFVNINQTSLALSSAGIVSGASIIVSNSAPVEEIHLLENIVPPEMTSLKITDDLRGRGYEPPELKKILERALMFMEE